MMAAIQLPLIEVSGWSLFKIPEDAKCQSRNQVGRIEAKSGKGRSYVIKTKEPEVRIEDRVAEQVKRSNQG